MSAIINLENGKLKMYNFKIENDYRMTQILGDIAVSGGNSKEISQIAWHDKDDERNMFNYEETFNVGEKKYTAHSTIEGNESEIMVDYCSYCTGQDKWVGRDEYERIVKEYEERYTIYKVTEFYKQLGELYYLYKRDSIDQYESLINFFTILNKPESENLLKLEKYKEDIIKKITNEEKDSDLIECMKQLKSLSADIKLKEKYRPELSKILCLLEYQNQYMLDLNKLYEYVINNESSVVSIKKFIKKFDVKEFNFDSISKKILKKEYNPSKKL